MSPSRTGPFTLRIIWRFWSSRNFTRTWVTCEEIAQVGGTGRENSDECRRFSALGKPIEIPLGRDSSVLESRSTAISRSESCVPDRASPYGQSPSSRWHCTKVEGRARVQSAKTLKNVECEARVHDARVTMCFDVKLISRRSERVTHSLIGSCSSTCQRR
jgi:hypothetical protein